MLRPSPRRSFYVVVSRSGESPEYWCWEIRRKWKPMACEHRFRSHRAAELAGRGALEDFLNGLSMETGSR